MRAKEGDDIAASLPSAVAAAAPGVAPAKLAALWLRRSNDAGKIQPGQEPLPRHRQQLFRQACGFTTWSGYICRVSGTTSSSTTKWTQGVEDASPAAMPAIKEYLPSALPHHSRSRKIQHLAGTAPVGAILLAMSLVPAWRRQVSLASGCHRQIVMLAAPQPPSTPAQPLRTARHIEAADSVQTAIITKNLRMDKAHNLFQAI